MMDRISLDIGSLRGLVLALHGFSIFFASPRRSMPPNPNAPISTTLLLYPDQPPNYYDNSHRMFAAHRNGYANSVTNCTVNRSGYLYNSATPHSEKTLILDLGAEMCQFLNQKGVPPCVRRGVSFMRSRHTPNLKKRHTGVIHNPDPHKRTGNGSGWCVPDMGVSAVRYEELVSGGAVVGVVVRGSEGDE